MFGDQHLKTAVALIELHKVRYRRYPDSLRDLKFTGEWDQAALMSVRYYSSPNRDTYYIEVERGWMGKPKFGVPAEFWKGTGYSPRSSPQANEDLTFRWSQPLAALKRGFQMTSTPPFQIKVAIASGGSAPFRWVSPEILDDSIVAFPNASASC